VNAKEFDKRVTGKGEVKLVKITDMLDIKEEEIGQVPHSGLLKLMEENTTEKVSSVDSENETLEGSKTKEGENKDNIDASSIKDVAELLNLAYEDNKDVLAQYVDSNPKVVSQMLSMSITDLVKAFQVLHRDTKNLKETYIQLFKGISTEGAEPFVTRILSEDSDKSSQVEVIDNFHQSGHNIAQILGKDKINQLVQEYVQSLEKDPKMSERTVDQILDKFAQRKDSP